MKFNKNAEIAGEDRVYGNWAEDPDTGTPNEYNDETRDTTEAGIGTTGNITDSGREGTRDFDQGTGPQLVTDPSSSQMTFPFDLDTQSEEEDERRMNFLRDEARRQGNCELRSGSGNEDLDEWPDNSDDRTVVFIELENAGRTLKWDVPGDCNDDAPKRGTLVVENVTSQPLKTRLSFKGLSSFEAEKRTAIRTTQVATLA